MTWGRASAVQVITNHVGVFGIGHLLEAVIVWLVLFRYRSLVPIALAFTLGTQVLGVVLLSMEPLPVVPPGQIAIYVMLPLTSLAFLLSIRQSATAADRATRTPSAPEETIA